MVEGSGLENRRREIVREFESLLLRKIKIFNYIKNIKRRVGRLVMQRIANPYNSVQFRDAPVVLKIIEMIVLPGW